MRGQVNALVCGLIVAASGAVNADAIYKSTDANGHVVYSDRPQSQTAQPLIVRTERASPEAVQARIDEERAALAASERSRRQRAEAEQAARSEKEKAEREQRGSCQLAQSRVRRLDNERQAYTFDTQGNRVYPSKDELAAQREAAREEMERSCD